ncbi:DL-endopeptidase inhibitor IseA family protein [Clostridium lundense]|uniref:DL-endopeptidase inhibitor IseA family protein n=1 Tax=Clostridium lundense TaxID=319475 RepID=UPI000488C47B|nr:DL-endopeptidase inhibitor IseA family protein [Clostridium lundense]
MIYTLIFFGIMIIIFFALFIKVSLGSSVLFKKKRNAKLVYFFVMLLYIVLTILLILLFKNDIFISNSNTKTNKYIGEKGNVENVSSTASIEKKIQNELQKDENKKTNNNNETTNKMENGQDNSKDNKESKNHGEKIEKEANSEENEISDDDVMKILIAADERFVQIESEMNDAYSNRILIQGEQYRKLNNGLNKYEGLFNYYNTYFSDKLSKEFIGKMFIEKNGEYYMKVGNFGDITMISKYKVISKKMDKDRAYVTVENKGEREDFILIKENNKWKVDKFDRYI